MGRRDLLDERVARAARRMSLGSLGGRSEQAQPASVQVVRAQVARSQMEVVVFNVIGDMEVAISRKKRAVRGGRLILVTFEATAAGTGTTSYRLLDDGVTATSTFNVASGTLEQENTISTTTVIAAGSVLQLEITAAGMHEEAVVEAVMVA